MATILARPRINGSIGYTVIIRIQSAGKIVHRESKTFSRREVAERWANQRELELAGIGKVLAAPLPVRVLLRWYLDTFADVSGSKRRHLEFLESHALGQLDAQTLTSKQLVEHIRARRVEGIGPAAALNELIWIGVFLSAAKTTRGEAVRPEIAEEARAVCRKLHLVGQSDPRHRRPKDQELQTLHRHFTSQDGRAEIPMHELMWFAVRSDLRAVEICRLEWKNIDPHTRTGLLRDPRYVQEEDTKQLRFNQEAWDIVLRQPRTHSCVFPYKAKSVCAAFLRACKLLGIHDLGFDDLRNNVRQRLLERAYDTPEPGFDTSIVEASRPKHLAKSRASDNNGSW